MKHSSEQSEYDRDFVKAIEGLKKYIDDSSGNIEPPEQTPPKNTFFER